MMNAELLQQTIKESGLKQKYLAKQLHLSWYGFKLKVNGTHEFVASEIAILRDLLRLDDAAFNDIFFAKRVSENH